MAKHGKPTKKNGKARARKARAKRSNCPRYGLTLSQLAAYGMQALAKRARVKLPKDFRERVWNSEAAMSTNGSQKLVQDKAAIRDVLEPNLEKFGRVLGLCD